jgi:hypothetical protein
MPGSQVREYPKVKLVEAKHRTAICSGRSPRLVITAPPDGKLDLKGVATEGDSPPPRAVSRRQRCLFLGRVT